MKNIEFESGTVVLTLPFPGFLKRKKEIGFRFNIMAWTIMCQLFEPEIDFHQIEEIQKSSPVELLRKLILAAALSYQYKYKTKNKITIELVNYWLDDLPAKERDFIMSELNCAILNSKVIGKSMTQLIEEKNEKKK